MQRAKPAETGPWQVEIERRPGKLRGYQQSDREAGYSPEHRDRCGELDRTHIVVRLAVDLLRRRRRWPIEISIKDEKDRREAGDGPQRGMKGKRRIDRFGRSNHAEKGA